MNLKQTLLAVALALSASAAAAAQQPQQQPTPQQPQQRPTPQQQGDDVHVAPNAPQDEPFGADDEGMRRIEEALKPLIKKARETYPEVKKRFQAGLPPKHTLFITTRLHDDEGRMEQIFVAVRKIEGGRISGLIWNHIQFVKGFKHGDEYTFPEAELLDWTISRPDGTEEGNLIGKYFDSLRERPN